MAFSFDYVKDLNRKKTCFFNSLNQTLLQVPSPKIFCSTVNSRFKKDPKLQIYLPKAFISDNRFLDSLYKSFLDQTTLDLRKEKWIFLNREFTVIDLLVFPQCNVWLQYNNWYFDEYFLPYIFTFSLRSQFLLFQVQDLQVMRHTFEGVRVTGTFMLKSVIVKKTPSMAFSFDYIKDFSIMGGRFDRVSMWGFKLENCDEFNALGQSR